MDADAIARLKELAALKEAGILTEEEFSQQKAAILSGGGKTPKTPKTPTTPTTPKAPKTK